MTAPLAPLDELALLLRPAAGGVHLVSTGRAEQLALQRAIYGAASDDDVTAKWKDALARIAGARGVMVATWSTTVN